MQAIVRDTYGSPDVLRLEEVDKPEVGADEVLIRVHASSINAGDRVLLKGEPYLIRPAVGLFRPKRRGSGQDVAGTVDSVGSAVTDFQAGDEVFGEVVFGSTWAEYAVASASVLARKPANVSFEGAAGLPVAGMTALQAVQEHGGVKEGDRVLVNGGSGGVGSYAVQIARAFGAEVTAVCGPRHLEAARELGATKVIDYTTEDFTQGDGDYDVLLDVAGSRTLAEYRKVLKPGGTYVAIGGPVDKSGLGFVVGMLRRTVASWFVPQRIAWFVTAPSRKSLETLAELVESGRIKPVVSRRCELADVADVIRSQEAGQESGKVVVGIC